MIFSTARAWIALGSLTALIGISSGAYVCGRIEGWDRRDTAQFRADHAAFLESQQQFLLDLGKNQDDGSIVAAITTQFEEGLGGIRNDLERIESESVCPVDPRRGLLLDDAVNQANATIRAARDQLDGAASERP
jgi:hypothetical protein